MLDQHLNPLFLVILLLLAVCSLCDSVYSFGGSIGANEPIVNFNYTIPVATSAVACIFSIQSAQFSNVIMVANTTPVNLTLDRQSLSAMYLTQSRYLQYMDLSSTIGNRPQLVNLPVSGNSTNVTVYVAFYNLDLPTLQTVKVYALSIRSYDKPGVACFSCPPGTSFRIPNSCKCSPCATDYYGDICQYEVPTMTQAKKYSSKFYSMANSYYRIVNPPDNITITYSQSQLTHKINLYIQFQLAPGDIAGQINTYYSELGLPYSKLLTNLENQFTFPTQGRNIAITLHSNENTPPTTAYLQYRDANPQRLALILGLTLGLGLPLILLIAVCCLYKRFRKKSHLPANSFLLQKRQLNFYFPEVMAFTVFAEESKAEESFEQLNESRDEDTSRKQGEQKTCVVCLNPIEPKSKIRITYCRHIFHSHCLLSWFKKNENCPFCRHDCSISPTEEAYRQLKGQKHPFRKKDLVAAIIQQQKPPTYHAMTELKKEKVAEEAEQSIEYEIEDSREYEPTDLVAVSSRKKHRRQPRGGVRKEAIMGRELQQREARRDVIEE